MTPGRHILILVDRDWTHPQAGGTGTVLYGQVSRWIAAGHRVTVIAGTYPGAERVSRPAERLAIHRMGSRLTVFPRAAWATLRGLRLRRRGLRRLGLRRRAERVLVLRVARPSPAALGERRGRGRERQQEGDERGDAGPGRHDARW